MLRKPDAELVKVRHSRVAGASEHVCPMADNDMVAQHSGDERVMRISMPRVGGKQHLLLQSEVRAPMPFPVGKERSAGLVCGLSRGTAQLLSDEQRLVVVARERDERRISLHRASLT